MLNIEWDNCLINRPLYGLMGHAKFSYCAKKEMAWNLLRTMCSKVETFTDICMPSYERCGGLMVNSLRSMPSHCTVYVTLISDSSLDFRAPDQIHFPRCLASLLDHFLHPKFLLKRLEIVWIPSETDHDLFASDAICNLNLAVFENPSCKTHWKVPVQTRQGNGLEYCHTLLKMSRRAVKRQFFCHRSWAHDF